MTNRPGKSDRPTVPEKFPNNAGQPAAEGMEGRGLAKGNLPQQNASRTPSREDARSALERVRQAASKDKKLRFTALLHHIYNPETLRKACFSLKKEAAPGVDGETWRHYGETLEDNLQDLSHRLKRGAYRAKPVRRAYINKSDGRKRPLGVPVLEDKIVQRAAGLCVFPHALPVLGLLRSQECQLDIRRPLVLRFRKFCCVRRSVGIPSRSFPPQTYNSLGTPRGFAPEGS